MKTCKIHSQKITTIGIGGGCHWCTEAIYASLKGIVSVEQGWIASKAPNDEFSEAISIKYDEQQISLQDIIEIHLYTHSSTSDHSMRKKYRSAVYSISKEENDHANLLLKKLQESFSKPLATQALIFKAFKKSEEKYLDYFYKNPDKPFCQTYIQPKLKKLMQRHPNVADKEKITQKSNIICF